MHNSPKKDLEKIKILNKNNEFENFIILIFLVIKFKN